MPVTTPHAPPVEEHTLDGRDGVEVTIRGQHLGHGSSASPDKDRWFEVDLYRRDDAQRTYVIHTRGMSRVPGEGTRARIANTTSAYEVVELLTVVHRGKQYIPRQSARALAQAAQWDGDIREAYVNRAVT